MDYSRSFWTSLGSLASLVVSGFASSVCWDRVIDVGLLLVGPPVLVVGLVGRGISPVPYSVVLLKPGFLVKSNPSSLRRCSAKATWLALGSRSRVTCSTTSAQFPLRTPYLLPAFPAAGWRSTSPSAPSIGNSPDSSNACIAHQVWAFSAPLVSKSRND